MKEYPILFKGEMVRAILDGRKTQTRRVIKDPVWEEDGEQLPDGTGSLGWELRNKCPYGRRGDHLWVRETWAVYVGEKLYTGPLKKLKGRSGISISLREDQDTDGQQQTKWRPSIHLARRHSRRTLKVTGVRVERVQDISEADAKAEGIVPFDKIGPEQRLSDCMKNDRTQATHPHTIAFASLWDGINYDRGFGWIDNPWVWVVDFKWLSKSEGEAER